MPEARGPRRLAVQVPDHSVGYMSWSGTIRAGYGKGRVLIWDEGTYDVEKWEDDKIVFDLHGNRVSGRYALIRTNGKNWLLHKTR